MSDVNDRPTTRCGGSVDDDQDRHTAGSRDPVLIDGRAAGTRGEIEHVR